MTHGRLFGAAALVALAAVLACSGLGICWLQFAAARGHDCCDQGPSIDTTASCSSLAVRVDAAALAPPAAHVLGPMVPLALSVGAHADSMAAVLPTKPPPLVLRI